MTRPTATTGIAALSIALFFAAPMPALAAARAADAAMVKPLIDKAALPFERFTLANGLKVIVHTDRKAPVVAVSVWYDVGSKHEPKGKTGFAHLFEHLMFNGSENADGDWFEPMAQIGATSVNGSTWYDRTNYYQTVPVGALARTLYLESDRMGHLLGAVTQEKLSNQIGVVQNEKRQGDNQPFGMVDYAQAEALFPEGHPYRHSTIGSMADLSAASLDDVRQFFRDHYGPNNAVIALAGDIDVATAKPLMERFFGRIPKGPATKAVEAPVPTLAVAKAIVLKDRVPTTRIMRTWVVPGLNDPDNVPLELGASVLGGLASSRLDNALVRDEQLAVSVSAGVQSFAQMGQFEVQANVKPGVDPAAVAARLDALLADFVAQGPTAEELNRVVVGWTLSTVAGTETAGGKAARLAEGELYSKDPNFFAAKLKRAAAAKPEDVRRALGKWLGRPVLATQVVPGTRDAYVEAPVQPAAARIQAAAAPRQTEARVQRDAIPDVGQFSELDFPDVERGRLSNGIELVYARRRAVPLTQVSLIFDAGFAADPKSKLGLAAMTTALLKEGTVSLSSKAIAEREEELGASIRTGSSLDRTGVSLTTLSSSLVPALGLLEEVVRRPAFDAGEVERIRARQLAGIKAEMTDPTAMAARALAPALYGPDSPYGNPGSGSGTTASVGALTRDDLVGFHASWLRPDKAKLFVVSDLPLSDIRKDLEARFGTWVPEGPAGSKQFTASPAPAPRILLVDRKDSPQSQIVAAQLIDVPPRSDLVPLEAANDVVGGSFLSRINMNLRETKGWSYGVRASVGQREHAVAYQLSAPVQADRTGDSISALLADYRDFLGTKGVTRAELERTVNGGIRELPGAFETSGSVLSALQSNDLLGRPDDYYERLPDAYRKLDAAGLDAVARRSIDPSKFLWVVVGDADKVRPQLETLGLPVESIAAQ